MAVTLSTAIGESMKGEAVTRYLPVDFEAVRRTLVV